MGHTLLYWFGPFLSFFPIFYPAVPPPLRNEGP